MWSKYVEFVDDMTSTKWSMLLNALARTEAETKGKSQILHRLGLK